MKAITELKNLRGRTRAATVPMYAQFITSDPSDEDIARVNKMIIKRWGLSALEYIKDRAWKSLATAQKFAIHHQYEVKIRARKSAMGKSLATILEEQSTSE